MNSIALNAAIPLPAPSTQKLVAAIVRAVLGSAQTATATTEATAADPASAKLGSILNLLLNPKNGAALMDINLDQLVNNSALQNLVKQLPPELLAKPQVFEALVLQNTLLPNTAPADAAPQNKLPLLVAPQPADTPAAAAPALPSPLYRITLEWQNRLLQILSPQPFPGGSRLQLQINARGEIALAPGSPAAAVARAAEALPDKAASPASAIPPSPLQTLQQSARELLPRQQPLHTLVPLLEKLLQPATQPSLPPSIARAVMQLLRVLPSAEQLQDPGALRQAVENSGSFFEGRLAREAIPSGKAAALPAALFATDIKAQISALLAAIRTIAPAALNTARAHMQTDSDELVYTHKPAAPNPAAPAANQEHGSDSADSLLTQLGKLLQSGLARIQLNQLDSVSARQVGSDTQPPLPTWVVEVPLRTAYGADQLQLRIEQRPHKAESRTRQQWSVQIALDLHAAGKLTALLNIADKTVSATLWAEHEQTHRAVREELDYLRAGLESVGVRVTEMQCRHGMPPARSSALTQRLVDVHT